MHQAVDIHHFMRVMWNDPTNKAKLYIYQNILISAEAVKYVRYFADYIFKLFFFYMRIVFWLKVHWNEFERAQLTISQHWLI